MYYLYILQSLKDSGYYIGTTKNIAKRLNEHNRGKSQSTKSRIPFILKYSERFENKTAARKREIALKKNYQIRKKLLTQLGFGVK